MVNTALDFVFGALRSIGAIASGEPLTATEQADALLILNQMMDSWTTESLLVFVVTRSVITPAVLKQTYTLGAGGDFNIPRPPRLQSVSVISKTNAAQPLELPLELLDESDWRDIPVKNISSSLPRQCWPDYAFPLMNLNFWPIPSQATIDFAFYVWTILQQFADLATQYNFPPAYSRAIKLNLAVELWPEFPGDPERIGAVSALAREAKAKVKAINAKPLRMQCDAALVSSDGGQYNWLTDQPLNR